MRESLIDRLIDEDPDNSREVAPTGAAALRRYRESIRRDLENLLNTRWHFIGPLEDLTELKDSLLDYGVPDLLGLNVANQRERKRFVKEIADTIRRFEPRLDNVRVSVQGEGDIDKLRRSLRLRIEAVFHLEDDDQTLIFHTAVEPAKHNFDVESAT